MSTTIRDNGYRRLGRWTRRRSASALAVVPVNCQFEQMAVNQRLRALLTVADLDIVTCYPESIPPDISGRARVRSLPLSRRRSSASLKTLLFTAEIIFWSVTQRLLRRRYGVVYTIQDTSAVAGLILRARTDRWVLDVLDDPALSVLNAVQNVQRVKASIMRAHAKMTGTLLPHADLLLTIGMDQHDPLPRLLTGHYRVPSSTVIPLRQCVDIGRIRAIAGPSPFADSDTNTNTNTPRLTYVGYVSRLRGVDTLLDAGRLLCDRGVDAHIVLIGHLKTREQSWIDSASGELPGLDYLGVLPSSDTIKEMAKTTIGILPFPNRRETAPVQQVTGVEFLALGKPIVATDLPGARALVEQGVNGILVPPGDAVAMADAIAAIVTNSELAARMGRASYERAEMFDAKIVGKEIAHALRNR
ncbi:MAG: glycosyltransferase [Streptosporangiaceae bacterium]